MCRACVRLRAEGVSPDKFPSHDPKRRKSLDERIEERKRIRESQTVKTAAFYADMERRRKRVKEIQEIVGLSNIEYAHRLGLSLRYFRLIKYGQVNCTYMHLMMAQRVLVKFQNLTGVKKFNAKKAIEWMRVRDKVISLYRGGLPKDRIISECGVDERLVDHWTANLN